MEYIKIISSLGIGALGMYFMFELCKKMLGQVLGAMDKMNISMQEANKTMQKFVLEQHQEHKEIIKSIKSLRK